MDGPGPGPTFRSGVAQHNYRQPLRKFFRGATHQLECLYTNQSDLHRPQGRMISLCDHIRSDIDSYIDAVTPSTASTQQNRSPNVSHTTNDEANTPSMYMPPLPPPLTVSDRPIDTDWINRTPHVDPGVWIFRQRRPRRSMSWCGLWLQSIRASNS